MSSLQVVNPFDQSIVCEVPIDGAAALEEKLNKAQRAFGEWRRLELPERLARVSAGLERFRASAAAMARDITLQMGKPIDQARREVATCLERAEFMGSIAASTLAPDVLPPKEGFHRRIEHQPLGVVLDIAAWNYPLLIPVNVVVPALLAGNAVLLKHSAKTPLCGQHFERAFSPSLPAGLLQSLVASHAAIVGLITSGKVQHVAFTGSVEGGRQVYAAAAQRLLSVGLELGGKDAAYVAADADLDFTAENVVDGACYNAGQSCCAVERLYVHRSLYEPFLERARAVMERYRLGDPAAEETTLGPLAEAQAPAFLEKQVTAAVRGGARLLLGGKRLGSSPGNFFPPTLLADVRNDQAIMREESFGPVLPVMAVSGDEEAIEAMNDSRFGLTASVWTRDPERAERLALELAAGTVYRNRCDFLDPALPWTGWGESGLGSTLSRYGYHHLTRRKSIHFRMAP